MQDQSVSKYRSFQIALWGTTGLTVFFLGAFIFGESAQAAFLSNYFIPIAALLTTLMLAWLWQLTLQQKSPEKTFRLFMIGFGLWSVAELLWLFFVLGGLDPYPSVADIFWLAGYLPIFLALRVNLKNIHVRPAERFRWWIGGIIFLGLLSVSYFIIQPILVDFDAARWLESIVNVAYPLFDLIILTEILALYLLLGKGRFSLPWLLISIGFIVMAIADLGYSYADWNGLYDSEQGNLISRLIDAGYLINYPIFALGIYSYRLVVKDFSKKRTGAEALAVQSSIPNTLFVAFADQNDHLLDISENFLQWFGLKNKEAYLKNPLEDVLGQPDGIEQILDTIKTKGKIANAPLTINASMRGRMNAWVSGIAIIQNGAYIGANLVIKVYLQDVLPAEGLSEYHNSVATYVLKKTESELPDFSGVLLNYASKTLQSLATLITEYNGKFVATTFYEGLQKDMPAGIRLSAKGFEISEELSVNQLAERLKLILNQAYDNAAQQTSAATVTNIIQHLENEFDPMTLAVTQDYKLR